MMEEKILVSIIVPIYNMEKLLPRCIESILNQTYQSLELILVDDGSQDKSLSICSKYAMKDQRVIIVTQKNSGVSNARNAGMRICTGQWIMFVDPDDYLKRQTIAALLSEADEYSDVVACCCEIEQKNKHKKVSFFDENYIFEESKNINKEVQSATKYKVSSKRKLYLELLDRNYDIRDRNAGRRITATGVPWGKIYRASFLKTTGIIFDPELIRMQDNIFNMYIFEKARRIKYIDMPFYYAIC